MKEKLLNALQKINILLVLFAVYTVKMLVIHADYASALVLLVLGMAYLGQKHIALKEPAKRPDRLKEEVDKLGADMKEIKGALTKVNLGQLSQHRKSF